MSKILNTTLMATLFISSAFAMEDIQNNEIKIGQKINEVPLEIIAQIADYCLGNFPENRNDFIKRYNNLLNLQLVNKTFKDSIDKHFNLKKIRGSLEDYLLNIIKNKYPDNSKDSFLEDDFAAEIGSKKYFIELDTLGKDIKEETLALTNAFKIALENKNLEIAKIIFNKHICPKIDNFDYDMQKLINDTIKMHKNDLNLDTKTMAKLHAKRNYKICIELSKTFETRHFLAIWIFSTITAITLRYFFPSHF